MRYICCLGLFVYALTGCKPQPAIAVLEPSPPPVEVSVVPTVDETLPISGPVESPSHQPDKKTEIISQPTPALSFIEKLAKPAIALPPPPVLSDAGYQLILDFEVGGGQRYYDRLLARPTWPGAASGVTVAIGYDLGYNSKAVILSDWNALSERNRLANVAGITGTKAKTRVAEVRDILIAWKLAEKVFNDVTLSKFYSQAKRAFPGLESLHPNAQAALVSLVFNRGPAMSGPNRLEMRNLRDMVPKRDYDGMAYEFRKMVRVWRGTAVEAGLTRRRIAEAKLVQTR